jgi:phosphoribosylformylglycinamidine synthase
MATYLVQVRDRHHVYQRIYLFAGIADEATIKQLTNELLYDPVVQDAQWYTLAALDAPWSFAPPATTPIEIAFKPGVTDNEAESIRTIAEHLGIVGLRVATLQRHFVNDEHAATTRYNPLIQRCFAVPSNDPNDDQRRAFYTSLLEPASPVAPQIRHVPLSTASDEDLLEISRKGILALDLFEMRAIQWYFNAEGRDPTDGELETLAQTWSEHCSHKTFKARVDYRQAQPDLLQPPAIAKHPAFYRLQRGSEIDSLIRTFLMSATQQTLEHRPSNGHLLDVLSAFVDNAGIVTFGSDYELSLKVETHNHPSALEPFGGANTGVGGVVRDVLGVSARPIANLDVLCFGPHDLPAEQLPPGVLHPQTIATGVVAGIRDYGNKLGIPTVGGAVFYHPGYINNPLVYCGTLGLAPRNKHPRNAQPGDHVVVIGGRTGRDGIHGATFSSVELTTTTASDVGSAVQIGDPITEKKMIDVVLQARDLGLYSAITDCGAGGLSSAVGEMGEQLGVTVELEHVPLKYAGLQPWEIWLSEAQERMVVAVPPAHLNTLLELCASENVEATALGRFTNDQRLTVTYQGTMLVDLSMRFLHHGMPQRILEAVWEPRYVNSSTTTGVLSLADTLLSLLAHPNIASKAPIIRSYDHEVGGRTVLKPLVGANCDGPGDASVLQPLLHEASGVALGCGINPHYGLTDPYWMALAVVDEALRNVVAVGADPGRAVILDNFCWGDPREPDRMAGLVRAAAGCYDAALAFGTPFISGKDSLNNEYRTSDGRRTPIPPTLLITALAPLSNVQQAVSSDLKAAGNLIYLVGLTKHELVGAHLLAVAGWEETALGSLPIVDLEQAPQLLATLHRAMQQGLVRACHDLSEGGLAVAAAEMAIGGQLGMRLDLQRVPCSHDVTNDAIVLFSESTTRFLVEVAPTNQTLFESALAGFPCGLIGTVMADPQYEILGSAGTPVIQLPISSLQRAWNRVEQE